jgi:hypothetical protein
MKNCLIHWGLVIILFINLCSCDTPGSLVKESENVRPLKDTAGFAQYSWQMELE